MRPIAEQTEAILASAPELTIRAGAGAGKTGVLVQRYLRHVIEEGAGPEEILAITFTRKAAADMKRRIVKELRGKHRFEEARLAQVGPISTAHGYCERLLREYPFDAGVDPRFDVLSESQAAELQRECARRAVSDVPGLGDAALVLVRAYGGQRTWAAPNDEAAARLLHLIETTVKKLRTAGATPDDLASLAESEDRVLDAWDKTLQEEAERALGGPPPDGWRRDTQTLKRVIREARRRAPGWLNRPEDSEKEREAATLTSGLAELALRAWRSLLNEFDRLRALDFTELEARACRLLEDRPETISGKYRYLLVDEAQDLNPMQYRLLRATPAEHRLFVGDTQQSIYRFRGAERELFIRQIEQTECHDLKTNWRSTGRILQAVETVFGALWANEFVRMQSPPSSHGETPGDDPFASGAGAAGDPVEVWKLPAYGAGRLGLGIKALIDEGVPPGDITVLVRDGRYLDDIAQGFQLQDIPFSPAEVGRNYFLRAEIYDLASALRAMCEPSDDLALLSFLRSPLVGLSLDGVIRLGLDANKERQSVWHLLRTLKTDRRLTIDDPGQSAVAGRKSAVGRIHPDDAQTISEFLEWFEPLSRSADRMSAWQALTEVSAATSLDARFAMLPARRQLLANARRLLEVASERREMSPRAFADWISAQQRLRTGWSDAETFSEEADAVRISTVHKAKGLEWNVVVVLAHSRSGSMRDHLLVDTGRAMPVLRTQEYQPMAWTILAQREQEQRTYEEHRLLYVAMTRAKQRLCLAVYEDLARDVWGTQVGPRLAPDWRTSEGVRVRDFSSMQEVPAPRTLAQPSG